MFSLGSDSRALGRVTMGFIFVANLTCSPGELLVSILPPLCRHTSDGGNGDDDDDDDNGDNGDHGGNEGGSTGGGD